MSYISNLNELEVEVLRNHLTEDFEAFSKFCFKILFGHKLIFVDYYVVLFRAIQRLINQECTRMIINIPPRAGKTLLVSQMLPLFAWVRNPSSHTILTGFNSDVLSECSGYIRTVMSDPDFRIVFPDVVIDTNKKSVEKLGTMSAGVLHAIPTTGRMTGKGCGSLAPGFAGFMSIDDVIKPDDAGRAGERDKVNHRFTNTLLSRMGSETTPLVIIMQRLHHDDLCGFLMRGGTSDTYEWLNIPGVITENTGSVEWYDEMITENGYTHVKPILYSLPASDHREFEVREFEGKLQPVSSFWKIRKNLTSLLGLLEKDSFTFYSQYMGKPVGRGKSALPADHIRSYQSVKEFRIRNCFITADTASTTKTYSDYSVFCYWGITRAAHGSECLVLLDIKIGKWEIPELIVVAREFWREHSKMVYGSPNLRAKRFYMEDKSSGLFLNQQFLKDGTVNVTPVPRDGTAQNDKFTRFVNTLPYFKKGRILIPANHEHYDYVVRELVGQTSLGPTTGHDDVADNFSDAVVIAFAEQSMSYESWS